MIPTYRYCALLLDRVFKSTFVTAGVTRGIKNFCFQFFSCSLRSKTDVHPRMCAVRMWGWHADGADRNGETRISEGICEYT